MGGLDQTTPLYYISVWVGGWMCVCVSKNRGMVNARQRQGEMEAKRKQRGTDDVKL